MILVADNSIQPIQILSISFMLIGLLVAGCFAVMMVKRRLRQPDDLGGPAGFTLSDLREMRKTGQISDEEFDRAKEKIVEASRRAAEREAGVRRPGSDLIVARQNDDPSLRQDPTDADDDPEQR